MMKDLNLTQREISLHENPDGVRPGFELTASLDKIDLRVTTPDGRGENINLVPKRGMPAIGKSLGSDIFLGVEHTFPQIEDSPIHIFVDGPLGMGNSSGRIVDITLTPTPQLQDGCSSGGPRGLPFDG